MENYHMEIKSNNHLPLEISKLRNDLEKRNNIIKLLTSLLDEIKVRMSIQNSQLDTLLTQLKHHNYDVVCDQMALTSMDDLLPPFKERLHSVGVNEILLKNKYSNLTNDIFKYLNAKDLLKIGLTCKYFRKVSLKKEFWKHLYFKEFDTFLFFDEKDICEVVEGAKDLYQNTMIEGSSCKDKEKLENFNFQKKYVEFKKINKSWEADRPVVTTISTSECVTCLHLDPQSNELIYSAADGSASLFRLYSYRKIASDDDLYMQHHKQTKICDKISSFFGHGGSIWCVDRCEDILFTGSYDKTIKIWETRKGECLNTIRAHSSWVSSIHYDKVSEILISGSWDSTVKLWNIKTLQNSLTLSQTNGNYVYCVRSNLCQNEVLVGTEYKSVDIWNVDTKTKYMSLIGHSERVTTIKNKDQLILSGSEDKHSRLWDKRTGQCEILFTGHTKGITEIEYDHLNWRVITASNDKTIKLWDIRKNIELRTLVGHSNAVCSIAFDQTKLISGSKDNSIRIWNFLN